MFDELSDEGGYVFFELGRAIDSEGRTVHRFAGPSRRLLAAATTDRVFLKRQRGLVAPGLPVTTAELGLLVRAARRWAALRDGWAAYEAGTGAGHVPGFGGRSWVYYPPYGKRREIGRRGPFGAKSGRTFAGRDEERPIAPPEALEPGLEVTHRLWCTEPGVGPPEGELTGEVLRLGAGGRLVLVARRFDLIASAEEHSVALEQGEEGFLEALTTAVSAFAAPSQ